ncbi:toxin YdaT family protein [Limnobaculum xujianqingii]|uniref:toxin YdaT family protein n=1 Tax=Limnobaculum xujianqingii TaxID=2738837 RepID=UPI00112E8420|nr:toxin YdaT family protein [Limnobaculum xujianqingii]
MKITHDAIREEIEAWAIGVGQKTIVALVTKEANKLGLSDLLPPYSNDIELYNNRQQFFRWVRSNHRSAVEKVSQLWPAIEKSLPGERRARLIGEDLTYLVAVANRECSEAVNAAILNDPNFEKEREEAINSLLALRPNRPQRMSL